MFDLSHLPLFVLASVAVLLMPGPNVLYVMARSMNQGRKAGMVAVLGLETGTLLQVTGAALGISAVEPARGSLAMQTELLGLIFIALATTTDGGYALLAASLRQRLRRSKHFATGQRYFTATMFIALSVGAALTERAREEES
jgi:threonine/homoserine/homoserine lactone efflux protein